MEFFFAVRFLVSCERKKKLGDPNFKGNVSTYLQDNDMC